MNTNTKIPMARTPSLSDSLIEATEIWLDVGNNELNMHMTEQDSKEFNQLVYAVALNDEPFIKSFMEIYTTFNHRSAD